MTDLRILSARVSEATGPSRELDAEIANALSWRNGGWSAASYGLPHWTASIDRTAALIAERLPEDTMISMAWRRSPLTAGAYVMPSRCNAVDGAAKTPALALLSAALLAIHERNKSNDKA